VREDGCPWLPHLEQIQQEHLQQQHGHLAAAVPGLGHAIDFLCYLKDDVHELFHW